MKRKIISWILLLTFGVWTDATAVEEGGSASNLKKIVESLAKLDERMSRFEESSGFTSQPLNKWAVLEIGAMNPFANPGAPMNAGAVEFVIISLDANLEVVDSKSITLRWAAFSMPQLPAIPSPIFKPFLQPLLDPPAALRFDTNKVRALVLQAKGPIDTEVNTWGVIIFQQLIASQNSVNGRILAKFPPPVDPEIGVWRIPVVSGVPIAAPAPGTPAGFIKLLTRFEDKPK